MCRGRTHARICLETEADLRELIASIEDAESKGHIKRWWAGERLTMAEMVAELVRREKAHRARSYQAGLARKTRRRIARAAADAARVGEAELVYGQYELAELE